MGRDSGFSNTDISLGNTCRGIDKRLTFWVVVGAVLYAASAFFIHLRWFPIGDYGVESDFYAELVVSAQRLLDGNFSVDNYPFKGPVYSFILVGIFTLIKPLGADWYTSAVLINSLSAAAVIVVMFGLLRRVFNPWVAVATTISTALIFEFYMQATKASSDMLYLLLFLGTVSALLGAQGRRRLYAAGVLAGLAFLTRYLGVVLVVAGAVSILWLNATGGWKSRFSRVAAFGIGFLTLVLPWLLFNFVATGNFLNDKNLMNIVLEYYSGDRERMIPVDGFVSLWDLIARDPKFFVWHYLTNIPTRIFQDLTQLLGLWVSPLVLLGLGGIALSFLPGMSSRPWANRCRPNRQQTAFFLFAICSFLVMCNVFHRPRFSLPLVPAYFAMGYSVLFAVIRPTIAKHWRISPGTLAVGLVLVLVSSIQVFNIVGGVKGYYKIRPLGVLEKAPQLRRMAMKDDARVLMSRRPHLAHYAGLDFVPYPGKISTWKKFFKYAHEMDVDLIVCGDQELTVRGETMILGKLDQAAAVTRLYENNSWALFRYDRTIALEEGLRVPGNFENQRRLEQAENSGAHDLVALARFDLAYACLQLGDWETGQEHLMVALQVAGNHPGSLDAQDQDYLKVLLASCYLKLDEIESGLELLGENMENLTSKEDAFQTGFRHFILARLLAKDGSREAAISHFRLAYDSYRMAGNQVAMAEVQEYLDYLSGR